MQSYNVCIWIEGTSKPSQIHPDDLVRFKADGPFYGRVLRVVASGFRYVRVAFGEAEYRVKRGSLLDIDLSSCIEPGKEVAIAGSDRVGIVRDVIWHHEDQEPNYYLWVDGKKKSRRYLPTDLLPFG